MFHHLDLIKTLSLNRIVNKPKGAKSKVRIFRHTTLDVASDATIFVNSGNLSINKSWNKKGNLFPFLL